MMLNLLTPLFRLVDRALPFDALSLIAVMEHGAQPRAEPARRPACGAPWPRSSPPSAPSPPSSRPPSCRPATSTQLAQVLVAHGLAPLASYQVRAHPARRRPAGPLPRGAAGPVYQGIVNDNVLRLVTLRNALKDVPEVPVVLLDGAAYVDWLYPHMAWRPVCDLRLAVRGARRRAASPTACRGAA